MSRTQIHDLKNKVTELEQQLAQAKNNLDAAIRAEAITHPEGWLVLMDTYPYQDDGGGRRFQQAKIFPLTTAGAYEPTGFLGLNAPITSIGMQTDSTALLVGENYDQEMVEYGPFKNGEESDVRCAAAFFTTDRKAAEAWQRAETEKIKNEHQDVTVLLLEEGIYAG